MFILPHIWEDVLMSKSKQKNEKSDDAFTE